MNKKPSVKFLLRDSYLAVINNSIGTRMYRNLYAEVDNVVTDVSHDGELSCAYFVSSVLAALGLIKKSHAVVSSTVKDLQESGWHEVPAAHEPPIGSVVVWENAAFSGGELHRHIGFYIGNGNAISNDQKTGCPNKHSLQSATRNIESIFWHPKLEASQTTDERTISLHSVEQKQLV